LNEEVAVVADAILNVVIAVVLAVEAVVVVVLVVIAVQRLCITLFALIAVKIAKSLLNQAEIVRFIAVIVSVNKAVKAQVNPVVASGRRVMISQNLKIAVVLNQVVMPVIAVVKIRLKP
jgi:hypothetical protein